MADDYENCSDDDDETMTTTTTTTFCLIRCCCCQVGTRWGECALIDPAGKKHGETTARLDGRITALLPVPAAPAPVALPEPESEQSARAGRVKGDGGAVVVVGSNQGEVAWLGPDGQFVTGSRSGLSGLDQSDDRYGAENEGSQRGEDASSASASSDRGRGQGGGRGGGRGADARRRAADDSRALLGTSRRWGWAEQEAKAGRQKATTAAAAAAAAARVSGGSASTSWGAATAGGVQCPRRGQRQMTTI
eukprot:COSAG05_NODE_3242_length_2214_cov_1.374941_2_plen_249_part_00